MQLKCEQEQEEKHNIFRHLLTQQVKFYVHIFPLQMQKIIYENRMITMGLKVQAEVHYNLTCCKCFLHSAWMQDIP